MGWLKRKIAAWVSGEVYDLQARNRALEDKLLEFRIAERNDPNSRAILRFLGGDK